VTDYVLESASEVFAVAVTGLAQRFSFPDFFADIQAGRSPPSLHKKSPLDDSEERPSRRLMWEHENGWGSKNLNFIHILDRLRPLHGEDRNSEIH
jgi:hypothetical protein